MYTFLLLMNSTAKPPAHPQSSTNPTPAPRNPLNPKPYTILTLHPPSPAQAVTSLPKILFTRSPEAQPCKH